MTQALALGPFLLSDIAPGRTPTICAFGDGIVRRNEPHAFLYPIDGSPFVRAHALCALGSSTVTNRDDAEWNKWLNGAAKPITATPKKPTASAAPRAYVQKIPGTPHRALTTPTWGVYWDKHREVTRCTDRARASGYADLIEQWPDLVDREWPECHGHSGN